MPLLAFYRRQSYPSTGSESALTSYLRLRLDLCNSINERHHGRKTRNEFARWRFASLSFVRFPSFLEFLSLKERATLNRRNSVHSASSMIIDEVTMIYSNGDKSYNHIRAERLARAWISDDITLAEKNPVCRLNRFNCIVEIGSYLISVNAC